MKIIAIVIISALFSLTASSQTLEKNFIDQNYIEVTGTAEMEIIPNEIKITISVNQTDFKTKQAFSDYEKQMIGKLKEIGLSIENEFTVMSMNSHLKTSLIGKDNTFSTKQYMVVVHNTEKANLVFDEMGKLGITTMAITSFDHSDIQKYRLQVKIEAIKAAKDKASALSDAIGQSIGKALYIEEINYNTYQPNILANVMYKSAITDLDEIEKVNFQKIKLKYSVLVRFELK